MKWPFKGEVYVEYEIGDLSTPQILKLTAPIPSDAAHASALIIREALTTKQAAAVLKAVKGVL